MNVLKCDIKFKHNLAMLLIVIAYLWLYIQQGDFALLMNFLDCLNLCSKHESLVASVFQQLICRDALGHNFIRDKIVILPTFFICTFGSGGVCVETEKKKEKHVTINIFLFYLWNVLQLQYFKNTTPVQGM